MEGDPSGGWRFAQCFGDKGEVEEITEGEQEFMVFMACLW
jgi:serine/threonine-protein phosphatase 2A regulatory subunit B